MQKGIKMLDDTSLVKVMLRRICIFVSIVPLAAALLSACIVSPIYTQISADVTFAGSLLPDVLNYTILFLDIIFAAAQYSSLILSFILFHDTALRRIVRVICVTEIVVRCLLNLLASVIIDGADFVSGIPVTLFYSVIETLQLYITVFIASQICGEATKRFSLLSTAAKRIGSQEYDWVRQIYPYQGAFKKSNPLQKAGLLTSVIFSALLVLSRLIYDFSYGAPESTAEILQMIVGYASDIIAGILVYIFILLFSVPFFKALENRCKTNE